MKRKVFRSLLSIIVSAAVMFCVFTSPTFKDTAAADVKIYGVEGRLQEIGEKLLNRFYGDSPKGSGENKSISAEEVYIGGYPIGLKLYADGVVVVGTESVDTKNGDVNPADDAGLKIGDIIKKIDGKIVESNASLSDYIEKSKGEFLNLTVLRNGKLINIKFKSAFSESEQKYKVGLWIRDSSAGIGTVTFCTKDGYFASLGHAVCDIDTKMVLPIISGECTDVKITGIVKGDKGKTGEMCGILEYKTTGEVFYNGDLGVYGKFNSPVSGITFPIADKSEVRVGEAKIYTTLENGVMSEYDVEISKINEKSDDNKNLIIKVTDKKLIEKTGGIIQGMSGSPIIQNGKIVGAVTHVFLDDPTGGYGIFAVNMMEKIKAIK